MSGEPRQNGVAKRRNHTLMDMVRSMLSYNTLPIGLWMEALKTAIHILNRVPSKSVSKMSYELWTGHKPSLNCIRVWAYPAEAKIFHPNTGKLEPKTVSCHFIGYPEKSKSFYFYCPDRHTKYVEMRYTIFLEDEMMRGSTVPREISLEEKRVYVPTPMIHELIPSVHVQECISLGCHLTKSIYGLKQTSRQWYLKFDETIRKFGFKENDEDNCIYAKFKNGNLFSLCYTWMTFY
jgi:hypothetical protein